MIFSHHFAGMCDRSICEIGGLADCILGAAAGLSAQGTHGLDIEVDGAFRRRPHGRISTVGEGATLPVAQTAD